MSRFNKTGGSTGSNQYQVRGTAQRTSTAPHSHVDLMRQISPETTPAIAKPASTSADVVASCDQFSKQADLARSATAAAAQSAEHSTDPADLIKLSDHPALEVRIAALSNRYTPGDTLRSHYLNMATSNATMRKIYRDEYLAMVHHPDCPPEVLTDMFKSTSDQFDHPRNAAAAHPNCPSQVLDASLPGTPGVVSTYHYGPAVLTGFTQSKSFETRAAVAQNRYTPPAALASLTEDTSLTVRRTLAQNPNTPASELLRLVKDKDRDVRESAIRNPGCPEHIRALGSLLR